MNPQLEHGGFKTEASALLNNILNRWVFSLWRPLALLRTAILGALFLTIWHYTANRYAPLGFWSHLFQIPAVLSNPLALRDHLRLFWTHFFNFATLRDIVPLLIPFLIIRYRAGAYLDDIFELDDLDVAVRFTDSAVFGLRYDTVEIENGEIRRTSRNSPILRIGGPGFIRLSLDSAALFEYADGRPHTMLPRDQMPTGKWIQQPRRLSLDGFERLRATFNLRNHIVPFNVTGRTLDGIPIEARDVRLIFSIWRCGREPTLEEPYPASRQALISLTYNQTARVGQHAPHTIGDVHWRRRMQMMISAQLRDFISHTPLEEFIASAGEGLFSRLENPPVSPAEEALSSGEERRPAHRREISGLISPRLDLPNYFFLFSQNFNARAVRNGVEMHWNGIGTWVFPDETINRRNLEAWRISRDNIIRTSREGLQLHREKHVLQTMRDVIRNYILQPFKEIQGPSKERWQKMVHRLITFFRGEGNTGSPAVRQAERNLYQARARFINLYSSSTPEPPPASSTSSAVGLDEDETTQEENRLRDMLIEQLDKRGLRAALQKLRQRTPPDTPEIFLLTQLARCLGYLLKEFEEAGVVLSQRQIVLQLLGRIEQGDCDE